MTTGIADARALKLPPKDAWSWLPGTEGDAMGEEKDGGKKGRKSDRKQKMEKDMFCVKKK
jgi:hypothetical protein